MESPSAIEPTVAVLFCMMALMSLVAISSVIGLLVLWRKKGTYGIKPILGVMLVCSAAFVFLTWNYSDAWVKEELHRIVDTLV